MILRAEARMLRNREVKERSPPICESRGKVCSQAGRPPRQQSSYPGEVMLRLASRDIGVRMSLKGKSWSKRETSKERERETKTQHKMQEGVIRRETEIPREA